MSLNSGAIATAILSILSNLSGMGNTQIGAPEAMATKVNAYVSMGSQSVVRKATGTTRWQARFFVMFAYRVDGAEATAETTLMALVDAFIVALHNDLTLNGTVNDLEFGSLAADEPDYQLRAGKEYREYPTVITTFQDGSFEVNP